MKQTTPYLEKAYIVHDWQLLQDFHCPNCQNLLVATGMQRIILTSPTACIMYSTNFECMTCSAFISMTLDLPESAVRIPFVTGTKQVQLERLNHALNSIYNVIHNADPDQIKVINRIVASVSEWQAANTVTSDTVHERHGLSLD